MNKPNHPTIPEFQSRLSEKLTVNCSYRFANIYGIYASYARIRWVTDVPYVITTLTPCILHGKRLNNMPPQESDRHPSRVG